MAEVIIALDRPSRAEALELVDRLGEAAPFYKVGLELFTRAGPGVVRELRERGKEVFLDLKLHDIPNTVARTVESLASLEVALVTVHAIGGAAMLRAAARARDASADGMEIVAVTVLTSLSAPELGETWGRSVETVDDEVLRLAWLTREAGLDGVVSSAREAAHLRARLGPDALLVTPGIRRAGDDRGDQKRVTTPRRAVEAGADYLVVGRTVTAAQDPVAALGEVRSDMGRAS
jgi:orotidine-5'-phosphate decarboxylase